MVYGAYSELVKRYSIFEAASFDKAVLVHDLESEANTILTTLRKLFDSFPVQATGSVTATANLSEDDPITIGGIVYTFKAAPATPFDIDIGADKEESMLNLHSAIMEADTGTYYENTTINDKVESLRNGHILSLRARACGAGGNDLSLSSTAGALTLVAFSGGINAVPLLESLNIRQTAMSLLLGLAASNASGAGDKPLMDKLKEQIDLAWTTIRSASGLVTEEGNVLNASSMCPIKDSIKPAIDMCDPAGWGIDPNHRVDR